MTNVGAISATGILSEFIDARLLSWVDYHTADRLTIAGNEHSNELVKLAIALTVRALREGSTVLDLETVHLTTPETVEDASTLPDVSWPDLDHWRLSLSQSQLVTIGTSPSKGRPLRLVGNLIYLERYWLSEQSVAASLAKRQALPNPSWHSIPLPRGLNEQQSAAVSCVGTHTTSILIGGPGTGKTRTVAAIISALAQQPDPPRNMVLAAPTGKATARLAEEVGYHLPANAVPPSMTMHRLLGLHPARPFEPRYNSHNQLPYDVVIVDETSMMSLTQLDQLLAAIRPEARLVLVGDRDQLASVEAGAVLSDLIAANGLIVHNNDRSAIVELFHNYRFGSSSAIGQVAYAIRAGNFDDCLSALTKDPSSATLIEADAVAGLSGLPQLEENLLSAAEPMHKAALAGSALQATAALDIHRLLCAHHVGYYGELIWNRKISAFLDLHFHHQHSNKWQIGQPLLITKNTTILGAEQPLWNGDSGVVINTPQGLRAAIARGQKPIIVPLQLLDDAITLHAMTVHKSQGSQFDTVSVILPPLGSPLLTRELLYTALTRARKKIVIYGSTEALRQAVTTPARRASGFANYR